MIYNNEADLTRHYRLSIRCKIQWEKRELEVALMAEREAFERATRQRRTAVRMAASMDFDEPGGGEFGAEAIGQGEPVASAPSPVAAPPLGTSTNARVDQDTQDVENIDPITAQEVENDFDNYMFGTRHDPPMSDDRANPCLEEVNEGDLEEEDSGDATVIERIMEDLGNAMETVQIAPEDDEEVDPSEIESFVRAGEVKERIDSHYENILDARDGYPFHPFTSAAEFELAKWLNDLPLSKTDSFLQLDWVSRLHHSLDQ
jgi:hypothetical protein